MEGYITLHKYVS